MANWKLGKLQYGFNSTATSGGTLILTASSRQFQILTGTMNHTVRLPNATTAATGVSFIICNQSTGTVSVSYNDTSSFIEVKAGQTTELFLTNISTSNGVWRTVATGGSFGIGAVDSGALITSNYSIAANDNGRVLNVDTSSTSIEITLPVPVAGFKITIKDDFGDANVNPIVIKRNSSELIDFVTSDDQINESYRAVSLVSDGTDWYRIASFIGGIPSLGGRALFGGGNASGPSNIIDYVAISSLSNATDFGDLATARYYPGACSSSTRGVWGGGDTSGPGNLTGYTAVADYVTIATLGNATSFGNLSVARSHLCATGNETRGLFVGGMSPGITYYNTIDYITIATTGNAIDFGDLTSSRGESGSCSSSTISVIAGGTTGSASSTIDYVTIASLGNATSFGSLTVSREGLAGCSSSTRGLFGGGYTGAVSNVIDYITIASVGNATDFGDLTVARFTISATGSKIRGLFAGGVDSGLSNVIDYVTIASLGNATDFGDLTVGRQGPGGLSDSHGGL